MILRARTGLPFMNISVAISTAKSSFVEFMLVMPEEYDINYSCQFFSLFYRIFLLKLLRKVAFFVLLG